MTTQTLSVYPARDITVIEGVAEGDQITFADDLVMDDIYALDAQSGRRLLSLILQDGHFAVAPDSDAGRPGNRIHLDCCLTLMAPDGTTCEALILVETEADEVAEVHVLPFVQLEPRVGYRLVGVDRHAATLRLAETAYVSFTRGTHITLGSGAQVPVERLVVGDKVLTRDDGAQPIRWIGHNTLRAAGALAPVVIAKGVLHNENDLVVSPDHRIFVYQRQDRLGAGRAEVLVKARHLINGTTVFQRHGGFVEYFQLLFDDHQIIYAEGIAAESLLIDPRTRPALPAHATVTGHAPRRHQAYEVQESLLSGADAVDLLRRASSSG